jgi:tRNA U34 5-methylaminomethyl-2-thiouridine-forming methyltransferase MnmC
MDNISIIHTKDGSHSVLHEKMGISYHSHHGAIQESQHVFIDSGLLHKAKQEKKIAILEIGLGTGLNAFMSFLTTLKNDLQIQYTGVEAYPLPPSVSNLLNYPHVLEASQYTAIFSLLHSSAANEWTSLHPHFQFYKQIGLFEDIQAHSLYDIIYFDAFAPSAQAHLWELPMMQKMYDALRPSGVLVTYCAKGDVRRTMQSIGFSIERLKGPIGKREMLRATKPL